jgi:hypothetical protein
MLMYYIRLYTFLDTIIWANALLHVLWIVTVAINIKEKKKRKLDMYDSAIRFSESPCSVLNASMYLFAVRYSSISLYDRHNFSYVRIHLFSIETRVGSSDLPYLDHGSFFSKTDTSDQKRRWMNP